MKSSTPVYISQSVNLKVGTPLSIVEQIMILKTLEVTKSQLAAARLLGISVRSLQRKLKSYTSP